jgi:hypothetical protein
LPTSTLEVARRYFTYPSILIPKIKLHVMTTLSPSYHFKKEDMGYAKRNKRHAQEGMMKKNVGHIVRPRAAGLLIGIECSRVRDSSWMYLTSLVTARIGIELAAVQRKLPDCVVVGLQLYSVRTFHVTLFPRIYKGGQGPPQNNQHLRQYKQPQRT